MAGLTLLPALLTIFGRRGFWPRRRLVAYDPEHAAVRRQGVWRRLGDRVLQRPGVALAVTGVLFLAGALGLLAYKVDYSTTTFFKKSVESVEGFNVLRDAFPAGPARPDDGAGRARRRPGHRARTRQPLQRALEGVNGVARVTPTGQLSGDGRVDRWTSSSPRTR